MGEEILEPRVEVVAVATETILEVPKSVNLSSNVSFVMRKLGDLRSLWKI